MSVMHSELRQAYLQELALGRSSFGRRDYDAAMHHLERAHILGQRYTLSHVHTHWWMLRVGLARTDAQEIVGQVLRLVAALAFSRIWVPIGNTGGANVSALKPMPVPEDLKPLLEEAR